MQTDSLMNHEVIQAKKFTQLSDQKRSKFPTVKQKYASMANLAELHFTHFNTFREQALQ